MFKKTFTALAAATLVTALTGCSGGGDNALALVPSSLIYTSDGTSLYSFNSQDRLTSSSTAITGLTAGTTIVGLDFNPNNGTNPNTTLNGLGSDGQVYTINTTTGAATLVGSASTTTSFANKAVDIDFNPRVQNVFRVTTSALDNHRRNALTGARPTTGSSCSPGGDCGFKYATGDVNAGKTIAVSSLAYTNSGPNSGTIPASTVVYVIDVQNNVLARLGSNPANGTVGDGGNPNEGILNTVGALGFDLDSSTGFDIESNVGNTVNNGYAAGKIGGDNHLFVVNLTSGALTDAGIIPPGVGEIKAFAVVQK